MSKAKRAERVARGRGLLDKHFPSHAYLYRGMGYSRLQLLEKYRRFIAQDRVRGGWEGVEREDVSDMLLALRDILKEAKS